ncbi:hypothetical protein LOZ64_001619 [Ophidiomyces ophidiicola]|uniref:uncharacterized protein n=1 Tax=Ophidiomyces ophidiicola TaxID=1387563 RepID=UPI0020C411DE|nr:uncharacterized protein LOZ57_004131 [Ophidiomyces ophidiicola]KAI1921337.1 hypothetical protein LOZ64_001619 [Ophidiomyces ophidiicola]KAI1945445.1 hypothetical protein LOZ57_004131 [Ophidiomyces ophidiicola]KAI2006476.1 hypothetical protein LOZ49_005007 [Ophidiomyces ophidiicola]KAI2023249.1 hypothetical protein LOZ46_001580 [Ophidiomyces ophidiicola]KAI2063353.1 hypothetical protein LOZ43_000109 [Ophidiomyces ophidiicola]
MPLKIPGKLDLFPRSRRPLRSKVVCQSQSVSTPPTNTQAPNASVDPFEAVKHRLEKKYKETIQSLVADGVDLTPEAIVHLLHSRRETCWKANWTIQCGGHTIQLSHVADQVLDCLDKFKAVGDIAVNANPLFAGLPWAFVRFVLQAALSDREQMEAIFRGLNRILYVSYRCQLYERYYLLSHGPSDASSELQSAITDLYDLIFRFLASAVRTYNKSSLQRVGSALWGSISVLGFDDECKDLEMRAEHAAQNCERHLNSIERDECSKFRNLLRDLPKLKDLKDSLDHVDLIVTNIWVRAEQQDIRDVLKWVSAIPYEDHHAAACKNRTPNTGCWLFEDKRYQAWQLSNQPAIMWLHGIRKLYHSSLKNKIDVLQAGAGKTKLTSRVIDRFLGMFRQDYGVAYFYCNRYESSRRDPTKILQSLVKQLARSPQGDAIQQPLLDVYRKKERTGWASEQLSLEESEDIILRLLEAYSQTILIIDALDESYEQGRMDLIKSFINIVSKSRNVKFFISSRCDDDIKRQLEINGNIGIEATDNQDDISKFVKERIEAYQGRPITEQLKTEISSILLEKSRGMFQWAALQIEQILQLRLENDIRNRLGRLPKGLKEAYDELWDKIQIAEGSKPEIAFRAFKWVLRSYSPLTPEALTTFISRSPHDGRVQNSDLDIDFILDACCNLLVVDSIQKVCRFSHLSVQEYLENHQPSENGSTQAEIAIVTIKYLLDNDTDFDVLNPLSAADSLHYAAKFWPLHAREALDVTRNDQLVTLMNCIFSSESSKAYGNWLRLYNPDLKWPSPYTLKFPSPLYYSSLLGLQVCTEKLFRSGAQVLKEGKLGNTMVAVASYCHPKITRDMLKQLKAIKQDYICDIMTNIDGYVSETIVSLLDLGLLCCGTKKEGQTRVLCEEYLSAAAKNRKYGAEILALLLENQEEQALITENVVLTAAANGGCGDRIIALFLNSRQDITFATENFLEKVVENSECGGNILSLLDVEIPATEKIMKAAAQNWNWGDKIMKVLIENQKTKLLVTESVVEAAAANPFLGDKIIALLLEKHETEIPTTEAVLRAAAANPRYSQAITTLLLTNRKTRVIIPDSLFEDLAIIVKPRIMALLKQYKATEPAIGTEVLRTP